MLVLYRILDWAERRGVDVFLTQMWADVGWNSFPENAEDPVRRLRSAPQSMEEWAYGLGELIEHLIKAKAYTCIKWVCVCNEPEQDGFSWWQDANMKAMPITPGLKAARRNWIAAGLRCLSPVLTGRFCRRSMRRRPSGSIRGGIRFSLLRRSLRLHARWHEPDTG